MYAGGPFRSLNSVHESVLPEWAGLSPAANFGAESNTKPSLFYTQSASWGRDCTSKCSGREAAQRSVPKADPAPQNRGSRLASSYVSILIHLRLLSASGLTHNSGLPRPKGLPKTGGRLLGTPNKKTELVAKKLAKLGCDPIKGLVRPEEAALILPNTPEIIRKHYLRLEQVGAKVDAMARLEQAWDACAATVQ